MRLTDKCIVLGKVESPSGTDALSGLAAGARAAYAILAADTDVNFTHELNERHFQSGSLSGFTPARGTAWGTYSYRTELKWNGNTAGSSATPWEAEPCWRAAGFSATYSGAAPNGQCLVEPVSTGFETMTHWFLDDGVIYKYAGCANALVVDLEAGKPAMMSVEGMGLYATPADGTLGAIPVYDDYQPLVCMGLTFTINDGGGADAIVVSKATIDHGIRVSPRRGMGGARGVHGFLITGRNVTGSLEVEGTTEAGQSWHGYANAGTEISLAITLGTTNGQIIQITAPVLTVDDVKRGDDDGRVTYAIPFHLSRSTVNQVDDEISYLHT